MTGISRATVKRAIKLGGSNVWLSNAWNNFAPFAGLMLVEYEKARSRAENDEALEDHRADDERTGKKATTSRRKRAN